MDSGGGAVKMGRASLGVMDFWFARLKILLTVPAGLANVLDHVKADVSERPRA